MRVADPQLDRVHAQCLGQPVHLRLVAEACLHRPEPAHRPAGRVVGVHHLPVELHVVALVRPDGEAGGVAHDRRRAGGVGAAVEEDRGADEDQRPVPGRAVLEVHPRRVAVDVAVERLLAGVDHLHRPVRPQRQQAGVDLHRDVLAGAERAADAGERQAHLLLRQAEAGRDLPPVDVQPLRGDVEVDPAVLGRHGQPGLRPEEGLVLHPDLVVAGDDHVGRGVGVAAADPDASQHVAAAGVVVLRRGLVDQRGRGVQGGGHVRDRRQRLVVDDDAGGGATGGLRVVGGDDRHRLAGVAHLVDREDGLVGDLEAVGRRSGHVLVGQHGCHPGGGDRSRDVEGADAGAGVRAAQRDAPEHVLHPGVGGVGELAGDLADAVRAQRAVADPAGRGRVDAGAGGGHGAPPSVRAAARRTASRIFS